jgi:hypothetical protein
MRAAPRQPLLSRSMTPISAARSLLPMSTAKIRNGEATVAWQY